MMQIKENRLSYPLLSIEYRTYYLLAKDISPKDTLRYLEDWLDKYTLFTREFYDDSDFIIRQNLVKDLVHYLEDNHREVL